VNAYKSNISKKRFLANTKLIAGFEKKKAPSNSNAIYSSNYKSKDVPSYVLRGIKTLSRVQNLQTN